MAEHDRLTPAQRRAVLMLLTARTAVEVAAEVGCSERTLRRWRASAPFREAVRDAARQHSREASEALLAARRRAVAVLVDALGQHDTAVRLRAAGMVLEHGQRALDDDADERLARVEGVLAQWDGPFAAGASRLSRLA